MMSPCSQAVRFASLDSRQGGCIIKRRHSGCWLPGALRSLKALLRLVSLHSSTAVPAAATADSQHSRAVNELHSHKSGSQHFTHSYLFQTGDCCAGIWLDKIILHVWGRLCVCSMCAAAHSRSGCQGWDCSGATASKKVHDFWFFDNIQREARGARHHQSRITAAATVKVTGKVLSWLDISSPLLP